MAAYAAAAAVAAATGEFAELQRAGEAVDAAAAAHREALFPGSASGAASSRKAAMAAMEAEWAKVYGDPKSPETKAKIDDACRRLSPAAAPKKRRRTEA